MKRGIFLTLDALIALFVALTFITISFNYFSSNYVIQWNKPALQQFAYDSLTILDLDGSLATDALGKNNTLFFFLNNTSPNICGEIHIYCFNYLGNGDFVELLNATKPGCQDEPDEYVIAIRSFTNSSNLFYAKMEAWYK